MTPDNVVNFPGREPTAVMVNNLDAGWRCGRCPGQSGGG